MEKKLRVFILCGGKGTRLSQVSLGKPKSLVLVGGKPLLAHLIDHIVTFDIVEEIVFLTGYLGDQIEAFIKNEVLHSSRFKILRENLPLGTGGAILGAYRELGAKDTIILNGDTINKMNYNKLIKEAKKNHYFNCVLSCWVAKEATDYGSILIDEREKVLSFTEKKNSGSKTIYNGTSYLRDNFFDIVKNKLRLSYFDEGHPLSLEYDIFSAGLVSMKAYIHEENEFLDVGTKERFELANEKFRVRDI